MQTVLRGAERSDRRRNGFVAAISATASTGTFSTSNGHVDFACQLRELATVVERAGDDASDLRAGRVRALVEEHEAQAERIAASAAPTGWPAPMTPILMSAVCGWERLGEHAGRLLAAELVQRGADVVVLVGENGAASSAALVAPATPMASVPTGMPAGICTIDSKVARPLSAFDCTGTPSTGEVFAAVMPGRCAAPPAPAMMTSRPCARSAGVLEQRIRRAMRRRPRASRATPRRCSVSAADWSVSQSDFDP